MSGTKGTLSAHEFGGDWTAQKLGVLAKYLHAYTTALSKAPFTTLYVDAFAGTGYRTARREGATSNEQAELLLPDLADPEPQTLLEGSARLALNATPPFDQYIFIESNADRCAALERLKVDFPQITTTITILQGDANRELQTLCAGNWSSRRAVLFLDPYGMQVEWPTIEAIARTKAIDMWLLFPLGIGVNRLLTRSGEIPPSWRQRLDRLLGTTEWYDEFYRVESAPDLFGSEDERVTKASMKTIGRYFNQRLSTVFSGVAHDPGVLRNSRNNPLYLLCFAVGNDRGKEIALKIANHLLKELR